MGGNLLEKIWKLPKKRLDRTEYQNLSAQVIFRILDFNEELEPVLIPSLGNKKSFGDSDILCRQKSVNFTNFLEKWQSFHKT